MAKYALYLQPNMKAYLQKRFKKSLYGSAYSRAFFTLYGKAWREIQFSFKQFYTFNFPLRSLLRVMGIIISAVFRLLLGRSIKYSFAFTAEDRLIEGILKPIITQNGFYVDVGCNHPKFHSNTYGLYRKGWKGICIDGNQKLIDKYAYYRPKDQAVCQLVSDGNYSINYHLIENDVLSTVADNNLKEAIAEGLSYNTEERSTTTLTSILEEYKVPSNFELLSIDAEEHDFQVLKGLDLKKYQPRLIIVEDEKFDFKNPESNEFVRFLKDKNYALIGHILKNSYFLKSK